MKFKIIHIALIGFLFLSSYKLHAQNNLSADTIHPKQKLARNTVFIELLGNAGLGLYSVNYDRIVYHKAQFGLSIRGGFSLMPTSNRSIFVLTFPILVNLIHGKKNNHFEFGFGCTFQPVVGAKSPVNRYPLTANISYRYQKPSGGFFFKVGYTPVYYYEDEDDATNIISRCLIGISFGYSF